MKGDRDTEWVLLILRNDPVGTSVALRDGSRFGFGRRTQEIADGLREAFRAAHAAQWNLPDDRSFFEGLGHQVRFDYPDAWDVVPGEVVYQDGVNRWGVVILEPANAAAVRFERREASGRDRCDRFSDHAVERLREEFAGENGALGSRMPVDMLRSSEVDIGGCTGVRIAGESESRRVVAYAVNHRGTLFLWVAVGAPDAVAAVESELRDVVDSVVFPLLSRYEFD
jgi:hypothetical protein